VRLDPSITVLTGTWKYDGGHVAADDICREIDQLVRGYLIEIGSSKESGGWDTLYRDPVDGRLWERTYPDGGGPPQLRYLTVNEAKQKYQI
jgi:hypothetical protein